MNEIVKIWASYSLEMVAIPLNHLQGAQTAKKMNMCNGVGRNGVLHTGLLDTKPLRRDLSRSRATGDAHTYQKKLPIMAFYKARQTLTEKV